MTISVLFLCPHSAGKSLLANTYFRAAASRRGVGIHTAVAGTDPDAVNMPSVVAALVDQGFSIGSTPRLVTAELTEAADHIISIGCDVGEIPTGKPVVEWDVPMLSSDFAGAMNQIHTRAEQLAADLS